METSVLTGDERLRRLELLPPRHQLAFGAACCDRLVPVYEGFSLLERTAPKPVIREAHDGLWRLAAGIQIEKRAIETAISRLKRAYPSEERIRCYLLAGAEMAVQALSNVLKYVVEGDVRLIDETAELAFSSVYDYVSQVDHPFSKRYEPLEDFDRWAESHPLLLEELARQKDDLDLLASQPRLTKKA